ncbi:MAG: GNAT family N-acetyltransferase [Paracoccaceae bacterium]
MHEIRTERLRMRDAVASDVDGYMAFVSDYEVVKWTASWPHPAEREFTLSRCNQVDPELGFVGPVFMGDEQIGGMGVANGNLGYFFARDHWGRGYATEMARAVIARAFAIMDWDRITAAVFDGNPGSVRVLQKLGFKITGRDKVFSKAQGCELSGPEFTLTRADWLAVNPYEIRTERLVIRGLVDDDRQDLQRICVPDVARNMRNIPTPWGDVAANAWLEMSKWQGRIGFRPAMTLHDGTLIGALGIGGEPASCAYFIGKDYWGQGYATEAMRGFLGDVFTRFALKSIQACHFDDNAASGRVLQKLGFAKTGVAIGSSDARLEDAPETLYRLSRTQLKARP